MGWKGTIRSVGAAVRAAERDAKRRQRELESQQLQYEKMKESEQAIYEVDVYENHIDVIQSTHKECSNPIDWNVISLSEQPIKPNNINEHEESAKIKSELYVPGFIDRFLKREEKKRSIFAENIKKAKNDDDVQYKLNIKNWEKEVKDWSESVEMANSLLKGESKAKLKAIEKFQPFSEISSLGSKLSLSVYDNGILETTIYVHGIDIVPSEVKSLLKSGKLSVKNMAKGKFNEIYQDYVCSSALRVANELFSTIPDKIVIVTAVDKLLNSKTGHLEESPILSVAVSRQTLGAINLDSIDPSDSMNNFIHNMSFKKTKGFDPVKRIDIESLAGV